MGHGLYISDDDYGIEQMPLIDEYLRKEALNQPIVSKQRLFFSDYDFEVAEVNSTLPFDLKPAYDANGKPNFKNKKGELIPGVYSNLENEVYHSLDAISSSKIKKYAKSPAHYKRAYVDKINRTRLTKQTERTLDAGTYGHELVLEPEGFYKRYFRLLNPADHTDGYLHTIDELKQRCKDLGLITSGTKSALVDRILMAEPACKIFDAMQLQHITRNAGKDAVDRAYEVQKRSTGRPSLIDSLKDDAVKPYIKKSPIDPIVWDDAHRICKTIREHEFADIILQDGFAEVSVIAKCPETSMFLKVRFDWLSFNGVPADVKTTRSANPIMAAYQFADLGYDLQAYMYSYVGRLAGIPCPKNVFPFIACEYAEADICEVFELSDDDWEIAEVNFHNHIINLKQSIENDYWPGYTNNRSSILNLPRRGRV